MVASIVLALERRRQRLSSLRYESHQSIRSAEHADHPQTGLNAFAALSLSTRRTVREQLIKDTTSGDIPEESLVKLDSVTMHLPFAIGEYTDFYCSLEHVQNVSIPRPKTDMY